MELFDRINQLHQLLAQYNEAYRKGQPIVGDSQYDLLVEELRSLAPEHSFLRTVEPESTGFFGKELVRHPSPMLSTLKAYTDDEVFRFIDRVLDAGSQLDIPASHIVFRVTGKLDGLAGRDTGTQLFTRGDGISGFDISRAFDRGLLPVGGRGLGVGEIVCLKSYFENHLADVFEHPRNFMAGLVSADDLSESAQLALEANAARFVPYSTLEAWEGTAEALRNGLRQIEHSIWSNCEYPLDGIIIETTHLVIRSFLGATSHHPKWMLALKPKSSTVETTVKSISWQVGRGKVTPVLEVDPVRVSGAVINRLTAHHAGRVLRDRLGPNARIIISRSGEVIPKLESVLSPSPEEVCVPTHCPACAAPLAWRNDFLVCENTDNCDGQRASRIQHFFKTMGLADGFGPATIERLISNGGVSDLDEIYALDVSALITMGFGDRQAENLVSELARSRSQPLDDWRFLAAFGIHDLGRGDSLRLLRHIPLDALSKLDEGELIKIHGFGVKTCSSIVDGLRRRWPVIQHLLDLGFNLVRTPSVLEVSSTPKNSIAGKRIVFTGSLQSGTREDMQAQARSLGAETPSSVSGSTHFLVCGDNVGSTKTEKARKLGISVITERDYLALLAD